MCKRRCVNCRHNKRTPRRSKYVFMECRCDIDNHLIGYVDCFEGWCKRWAKDHKFDERREADEQMDSSNGATSESR